MDWKHILVDSGLLQALLSLVALVLAYYVQQLLARWKRLVEANANAALADQVVRAAWQLFANDKTLADPKKKMKSWAVDELMRLGITAEDANRAIEAAVQKFKQELAAGQSGAVVIQK